MGVHPNHFKSLIIYSNKPIIACSQWLKKPPVIANNRGDNIDDDDNKDDEEDDDDDAGWVA